MVYGYLDIKIVLGYLFLKRLLRSEENLAGYDAYTTVGALSLVYIFHFTF